MKLKRINELIRIHRDGLLKDTLPFWMKRMVDRKYGGFLHNFDHDGSVISWDKSVWIQGRITWMMSLLYNDVAPRKQWLAASKHGIQFLQKHCFDSDGRMFFELTREGRPLRKRRYTYSEVFGVIAFAEYALATGNKKHLETARSIYRLFIRYNQNPELLPPKYFPQTRQMKSHAIPMCLISITQQLRKHGDDPFYTEVIDKSLKEVFEHFMRPDEKALLETVGPKGERLDGPVGRCINPGHAIETAWFIMEEARYRNDAVLTEKACKILDWSLERGWDKKFGGILYFVDVEGKPCEQYEHDMKLWWPHQEALYACLLAFHLTGKKKYSDWYEKIHQWSFKRFPDKKHGSWFFYLHRDGTLSSTVKGSRWDGPFHLVRMHLYCWKLLEEMKKGSIQLLSY